jgi:hypothetical protein
MGAGFFRNRQTDQAADEDSWHQEGRDGDLCVEATKLTLGQLFPVNNCLALQ